MSKSEAIVAIANLLKRIKVEDVTEAETEVVIKLAVKEGVLETLLDGLAGMINDIRPSKNC